MGAKIASWVIEMFQFLTGMWVGGYIPAYTNIYLC